MRELFEDDSGRLSMARLLIFILVMVTCGLLIADAVMHTHDLLEGLVGVLATLIVPLVGWAAGKSVGASFANGRGE